MSHQSELRQSRPDPYRPEKWFVQPAVTLFPAVIVFVVETSIAADYTGPKETLPEAKEALKFAIIGIFCFGFIFGPLAIVKSHFRKENDCYGSPLRR